MNEDPTLKLDRLNNEIVKKECHDYQKGDIIHKEAIHNLKDHSWSSLMAMLALASIIERNIVSVYPGDRSAFKPKIYNGEIYPLSGKSPEKTLYILWSQINNLDVTIGKYVPNHFVPLINETAPPLTQSKPPGLPTLKRTLPPPENEKPSKMICLDRKGTISTGIKKFSILMIDFSELQIIKLKTWLYYIYLYYIFLYTKIDFYFVPFLLYNKFIFVSYDSVYFCNQKKEK